MTQDVSENPVIFQEFVDYTILYHTLGFSLLSEPEVGSLQPLVKRGGQP